MNILNLLTKILSKRYKKVGFFGKQNLTTLNNKYFEIFLIIIEKFYSY